MSTPSACLSRRHLVEIILKNSTETVYGSLDQFNNSSVGSSLTQTRVAKYYSKSIVSNGLVFGDRRSPNPFTFDIVKSGWGSTNTYITYIAFGKIATIVEVGPAMPLNYNLIGMQYTSPDWTRTDNTALAKVYEKLKGQTNNLVVDMAEGGQTVKMVKSVLNLKKFILTFVTDVVKHRKYKSFPKGKDQYQRRLDYVNGKWLEYRYGWTPLIHSIYDAADNINKDLSERTVYIKGRSGVRIEKKYADVYVGSDSREWLTNYLCSYRTEYGMVFRLPGGPRVSDWTSLNPIGIAYELMFLSFVIDWVADIGGYLSLWENNALFSQHFIAGYKTRSYKECFNYNTMYFERLPFTYFASGTYSGGRNVDTRATSYSVRLGNDRERLDVLPIPAGVTVKVNFGWKHQLDSVALLSQLFVTKLRH